MAIETIKFSEMIDGGDVANDDKTPGLKGGANVLFNNPWTFLPPGTTAERPAPSSTINYRLRFNTTDQLYEYYDAVLSAWTQLQESVFTQGPFITYTADPSLPDAQNLGALANGILKQSITLGTATLDIAVQGTDYYGPGDSPTFAGMTLTGNIDMGGFRATNAAEPVNPQDYATKNYVDSVAQGLYFLPPCQAATTGNLSATYSNGSSGIGATLIATGNGAISIDGVSLSLNNRVLVKNQTNQFENGIYTVTVVGDGSTPYTITRATDYDQPSDIDPGDFTLIQLGSVNANTGWVETDVVTTIGTDSINFTKFGSTGTVTSVGTSGLATGGPITSTGTITVTAASASDQQTGTSNTVAVTPGVQRAHPSAAKAWAKVSVSGGVYTIDAGYNMIAVSHLATGQPQPQFNSVGSSSNYCILFNTKTFGFTEVNSQISTNFVGFTQNKAGTNTDMDFYFSAFSN